MPESPRRSLPDNLDPLVDTLSNVVGILVVVVALTQLQVGDAIDRLSELDASRTASGPGRPTGIEAQYARLTKRLLEAEARQDAILRRSDGDVSDAIAAAEKALATLADRPASISPGSPTALSTLRRDHEQRSKTLEAAQTALRDREAYAAELERVPKELVARLPDPGIVTGEEAWILCRYARCYLADRRPLVLAGSRAIGEVLLTDGAPRTLRPDELESVAHHFRKRDIGHGNFRWRLVPGKTPAAPTVAQVEWRTRDAGIERTELASSRALRNWLGVRSPDRDFIRFQVWNDSFEVYLEARQVIESAGFRAGWVGFAEDKELELYLTFDAPAPREGPVEVD